MENAQFDMVFIMSTGRSGSTLMDMLLGAHPSLWPLGEVHYLQGGMKLGRHCGCGELLTECKFWQSVLEEIGSDSSSHPINYFQLPESRNKFIRLRWLISIIFGYEFGSDKKARKEYVESNLEFLKAVSLVAGDRRGRGDLGFVDATKHAFRLFWLLQDPRFNIRVIQLVKDPRAYLYSRIRREEKINSFHVLSVIFVWVYANALIMRIRSFAVLKSKNMLILYEEMADDPKRTLNKVGQMLNLDFGNMAPENFRLMVNHAISGNQIRLDASITKIRLDEKWKTNLSPFYKMMAWIVTWPVARILGYPYEKKKQ